ncbi:MAG: aldose 1-epimerase [Caulobacterales bacterium]|nr:aldose 1-epimerase [Caulobacterales bacterium]
MAEAPRIGGLPAVTLAADPVAGRASVVEAVVLPGRGFMLLQATVALPSGQRLDLLHAPPLAEAAAQLDGGPEDFAGNRSFAFGGALLIPYANRIRGRPRADSREIDTTIDGRPARLPRNWGGKAAGAETYAMHGLILATPIPYEKAAPDRVTGRLAAGDFGGRWPGGADLSFEWRLCDGELRLQVEALSLGPEPLPFGAGWHPYFRVPSGDRGQARLRVPAARRADVNDYDEVLPTGRLLDVASTPYDFRGPGQALGALYLDDCFTGLDADGGEMVVQLLDPAASLGLRVTAPSPPVHAVQVYAPPDQPFVVIEPQFNLPDPYGAEWPADVTRGMVSLPPGARCAYAARVAVFAV